MPYLIDGHNLIPNIPGLSLEAMDDEMQLVEVLQEFCRRKRKQAEVYFDNAPPGSPRARSFGLVTARFVRQGMTADRAIQGRLERLGRQARNYTVVSSDLAVQSAARLAQAHYLPSQTFAGMLQQSLDETKTDAGESSDVNINPDELDDWLEVFGGEAKK